MLTWLANAWSLGCKFIKFGAAALALTLLGAASALADEAGGEAGLKLPDLSQVTFLGIDGHKLLLFGIVICIFGLGFGLAIYSHLKNLPVHKSMLDVSELIYEACKAYLFPQGKFLMILWVFIAVVIVMYFGWLAPVHPVAVTLPIILIFSLVGIAGSYGVAWFGIRVNTFANSRTGFASLRGKPCRCYAIPLKAGMSIGMMLINLQLLIMLCILLFIPGNYADPCFIGFSVGQSLCAASLVWLTSFISIGATYALSYFMIPELGGDSSMWWKLSTIITCGTLAGAIIPELVKVFTSVESSHVKEVVTSSREGGASLNILSGLVAGNFSAYWLGLTIMGLMAIGYGVSTQGVGNMMLAPAVFAFGLVAFGFLGMGPVTIAVDSYGPVTDNAQSVYELSVIETLPGIKADLKKNFGFDVDFERAKEMLEANDGAGNTFKATAKPVLIGTAVVGATTMIFSIIMALTKGLQPELLKNLSILYPPFLLGLVTRGSVIYWFTRPAIQAVTTGAYRAVEFIKANINLESATKASVADSKKVVEICTQYAQKGMFNIFLVVFFSTLSFAFFEPYFFIGYLISIALFGERE